MREKLLETMYAAGGAVTRATALSVVPEHVLRDAVKARVVLRLFPQVFVPRDLAEDVTVRRLAALLYLPGAALSHLDALDVWGVPSGAADQQHRLHLTAAGVHRSVARGGMILHRRREFRDGPPDSVVRGGMSVVRLEQAIVESWALLPELHRRAPAIVAVRERMTRADRLLARLAANPRITGCAEMRPFFGLLGDGCHSELEIWGHDHVFSHRSLPPSRTQRPLLVDGRLIYLDRAFEAEMVDAELDGAAFHGQPWQRERDLRRDAAVARLGWLPVRFSHPRLVSDPADVRAELLDILAMRRRQLGVRGA